VAAREIDAGRRPPDRELVGAATGLAAALRLYEDVVLVVPGCPSGVFRSASTPMRPRRDRGPRPWPAALNLVLGHRVQASALQPLPCLIDLADRLDLDAEMVDRRSRPVAGRVEDELELRLGDDEVRVSRLELRGLGAEQPPACRPTS